MLRFLIQALPTYGPLLLFALICVESMGIPIPGETIVLAAAAFAAAGRSSFWAVLAATIAGGIVGGMLAYWMGRKGLARLALRSRGGTLQRTTDFFARHGGPAVVGGRFVAFVRSFLGIAAGMGGMPFGSFAAWNAVGAAVWGGCFAGLGFVFGRNLPRLERGLAAAGLTVAVLVAVFAAVAFFVRVAWPRRAEAAAVVERALGRLAGVPGGAPEKRISRIWALVSARSSPVSFLGAYMLSGLVLSLLSLWVFGGVLEDVVGGPALVRFDFALAAWLRSLSTPAGVEAARVFSLLGSPLMLVFLGLSVASRLWFRRQRIPALGWLACLAGGAVLAIALEYVVRRPAPPFPEPFASGAQWSFPSQHALGGLVGYGMLAYLLATLRLDGVASRVLVVALAVLMAVAIGASRMYLGLEYFSDVVGGFAAGAVWLGACITGVELTWRATGPLAAR